MNRLKLTGGVRTAVSSPKRKSKRFALSLLFALFGVVGTWAQDDETSQKIIEFTNFSSSNKPDLDAGLDGKIGDDVICNLKADYSSNRAVQPFTITPGDGYILQKIEITWRTGNGNFPTSDEDLSLTNCTLTNSDSKDYKSYTVTNGSESVKIEGSNGENFSATSIKVYYLQGPVFTMTSPAKENVETTTTQIVLTATTTDKTIKDNNSETESIKATFGKQGETSDISGTLDTENKTITFDISKISLEKSTTYELTLPAGEVKYIDNTDGTDDTGGTPNSEQTFSFTTVKGLVFTMTTSKKDGASSSNNVSLKIVLTPNKKNITAVDGKEHKIKVTYTPTTSEGTNTEPLTVDGETTIEDNTLVFTPKRNLRASMAYTVSLDAGVVTDGSENNEAFTETFTTASNEHMITGATSSGSEVVDGGYSVDMGSICMIYGGDKDRVDNAIWTLEPKKYADLDGKDIVKTLPSGNAKEKMRQCGDLDPVNEYCVYKNRDVGYGDYISTNKWGWSTRDGEFDHTNHLLIPDGMTHQKTFHQPCYGNLMFRPRVDGELTVYLLQQGALDHNNGQLNTSRIRKRPVYIIDETGTLVQGVKATTTSNIPTDYNNIKVGETEDDEEGTLKGDDMYTWEQAKALKAMYDQWIKDNEIEAGNVNLSQGVICLHHKYENISSTSDDDNIIDSMNEETYTDEKGKVWKYTADFKKLLYQVNGCNRNATEESELKISVSENNTFNDNTGFMLIDEGYIKYKFHVLAGKTYNIFGYRTKIGYIGFDFDEDPTYDSNIQTLTLNEENTDNSETIKNAKRDKPYDVTINRSFTSGQWATLVLPFSVGQLQVKEVFGEGTEIIHFDSKKGNTINLKRHIMQMIVGGTPVLIKPGKDVKDPVFTNVHFTGKDNTADIDVMSNEDSGKKYEFKATYDAGATVPEGSYFISGNDGAIYQTTRDRTDIKGFRAWIEGGTTNETLSNYARFLDFGDIPDNETTGIIEALADPTLKPVTGNIYDINGRLVRQNASSIEGLPKGIYIMNGKKLIVK